MIPKDEPLRSRALRYSARGQDCTLRIPGHCNGNSETTVLCHAPFGRRGVGTKASDDHAVIGCSGCHDALDHRALIKVSEAELYECVIRALAETRTIWRDMGIVHYG